MLQTTIVHNREVTIIFLAVIAIGLSTAVYAYVAVDKYFLLYYWDSVSHLVAARKFVDWGENPGLNQIGTVWMPLPHFLLLPFASVTSLFTTGFAGTALSLPCVGLTSVYLYKIGKAIGIPSQVVIPSFCALAGAMLYATNPNILYLGITSMTEAPFMLFFVASAYYFQSWLQGGNRLRNLILCSIFIAFATLSRYEAWFLAPFLIAVVFAFLVRSKNETRSKAFSVLASILSLSSIIFWLAWNQYHYDDPLAFSNAEYYSAAWYAENRPFREILFLQPANVLSVYGVTALAMYGPFVLAAGAIGYHVFRRSAADGKKLFLLFLALPPIFTMASLLIGIGEMSYWFNSRFMVLLSPLIVIMVCIFLARLDKGVRKRWIVFAAVGALFVYPLLTPAFSAVITVNDAIGGYSVKENLLAEETGEALKSLYDGNGKIMILTGSGLEHRVMITSGIALANFDEIIEHSTWKASFKEPWSYDRWIVITDHPGTDALTTTKYWLDRDAELAQYYKSVYENEYYRILVLK